MHTARLSAIVLILAGLLVGCVPGQSEPPSGKPRPTPPTELLLLPRRARIHCAADSRANAAGVNLWELPGIEPSDPNSAYQGNRGKLIDAIQGCTEVTATEYSWSETDQMFWVRVRAASGPEGWLPVHLLELSTP